MVVFVIGACARSADDRLRKGSSELAIRFDFFCSVFHFSALKNVLLVF